METEVRPELNIKPAKVGDLVEGEVIATGKSALYLDLSPIGTGIIFGKEFLDAKERIKELKIGEKLFAKIIDLENDEGFIELSVSEAADELTIDNLTQKKESGELIKVKILSANKGGLLAEVSGLQAFLPVSQLSSEHYPRVEGGDPQKILKELQKFVGQELEVKVFDLKTKTSEIIISEKAKETDKALEILKNYKVDDVAEGEITGLTDFGAFIKFGTSPDFIEGLIHISEMDWKIIEDPALVVKVGDQVKAKIIDISNGRVSLSLKALKEDPWTGIEDKFKKGDVVKGKVTKINPFGAFVQIAKDIQGLCHISEFGSAPKMEEALQVDKSYKFEIILIEPKEHRMSLKLKEKEGD